MAKARAVEPQAAPSRRIARRDLADVGPAAAELDGDQGLEEALGLQQGVGVGHEAVVGVVGGGLGGDGFGQGLGAGRPVDLAGGADLRIRGVERHV